ncbi:hypothetical protein XENTR_v10005765 [Xenopus tropicalis]|nr:hypothetical protein XENTR_v10005765 [Xenopus tropicalis]
MNLPASGFLQRFGSLTWRKKKSSVLGGSGLLSPESTPVDTHCSLSQLDRPVDSVSDLKDDALFADPTLESSDFSPKDNRSMTGNVEMSTSFDCPADGTVSYCSNEVDTGDTNAQLQSFIASNEKEEEENEEAILPYWAQSILKEYMPYYHKSQPSPVSKEHKECEEEKCSTSLHSELTYNTLQVRMNQEQANSAPPSPRQKEISPEQNQYSQKHPKCLYQNEEQDTPQLNPLYPGVQVDLLVQNVTAASTVSSTVSPKLHGKDQFTTQATPGTHKVRYEIIIIMKKEGHMDETDVSELGEAILIGEELAGPDLNPSPSLECQACGHDRADTAALTAQAHTEQPKKYTNLEEEKISKQKRGGDTGVRAHLDRDISLAGDEEQHLLVCKQTPECHTSQPSKMEQKCSLDNECSPSPGRAQPSRMVLSNNEVSRVPTNRDRESFPAHVRTEFTGLTLPKSYVGHVMDMRKVFESNSTKEDFVHNLETVKSNSHSSVRENKYTVTQHEFSELHKPIYSQVFNPPKPSLKKKRLNDLLSDLARKDSVNAAQAWDSPEEINSRSVSEKEMIHLRDRDVKLKGIKHKHTILPLKDLHVHHRTPTPPPDKSSTMSIFLTSPKGWKKENLRCQSPRPLHAQTDVNNMDAAKPVLTKSPDKFTFTSDKDGYKNYVTDSFSAKTAEEASGEMHKDSEINNNVLITNPHITSKAQFENPYTLSERQLKDAGSSEEVILRQESPVQDLEIISWEQTESLKSTDYQSVPAKSNSIIIGVSDDCYEQSNISDTVKSHITENDKEVDNLVASDHILNMQNVPSDQPVILNYTNTLVTANVYKSAEQNASQNCPIAVSATEPATIRNDLNPLEETKTEAADFVDNFGNSETTSFTWDIPAYSSHWPTSIVLENINIDNMNDKGWHKAKAQMVYTSTEDESEQKAQNKPISEVWTEAGNVIISHPEGTEYKTANVTEQDGELIFFISTEDSQAYHSGEKRKETKDGTAADGIGLVLRSTTQQPAGNEGTMQEHMITSYDSGIKERTEQASVDQYVVLIEDKTRDSNASQNVDGSSSVVANGKPVYKILTDEYDREKVTCLTQDALAFALKEASPKQASIQQSEELICMHSDSKIDITSANEDTAESDSDISDVDKTLHAYGPRERDLKKTNMANDNINIIDIAPSLKEQAGDLLAVDQDSDVFYVHTKEAFVEQDNDQTNADFLQKRKELVDQTEDGIDTVTCLTQDTLVFTPSNEEYLQQAKSQPSKELIHIYTNSEIDIMSEKEDRADSNIDVNDDDKTHQAGELFFHIHSKEIIVEHAYDQGGKYLEELDVTNDKIHNIDITPSVENQVENMSGPLAIDQEGDVLVYISTKEAPGEQANHQAITDRLQKLEQLVNQADNATDSVNLKKESDEHIINWEGDGKKDQMFDFISSVDVSEEHAFIQSKEYLMQKPRDMIDPSENVIDEDLEENPEENDSGLEDEDTVEHVVDMQNYRLGMGKSVEDTNEKTSRDTPVAHEDHFSSLTDILSSKMVQAEQVINFTDKDIKDQSNHSQNVIFSAFFNKASVEHNIYEPAGTDQGETLINQSNDRTSIVPTEDQQTEITGEQVNFITIKPEVEHHNENYLPTIENDMQDAGCAEECDNVTNNRNLLTQEVQKVENENPSSFIGILSHPGQIFSEISSKLYDESEQEADAQTTGHRAIENKMSSDVHGHKNDRLVIPSMPEVLTNLPEQSVHVVKDSQVNSTVHVKNDITTEYTEDQYNLQIEEESSKDMEMWINTLRHLEMPEFMKYQRVPRQPRHSALSMYATLPPIKEDVCSPNSDHIDSNSPPQVKNDDLEISPETKAIPNLEQCEKKYSWEKDLDKPLQISSPLEMMKKHSEEEAERTASYKSLITQNLSQRQGSIIGSLLLSDRQERKNEQIQEKSFSRLKSSLLLSSYVKPKKEPLSVNREEVETMSDLVHTEARSNQLSNVAVFRTTKSPNHPVTGTHSSPKHEDTVDSVPPLVSRELPCKSNIRTVSHFKPSTDIWQHTKKEHGKVNPRPGKVQLFSESGFSGKYYEIYGNVSDTSEWELQETISIRVIRGGWILYEEPRFHGRRVMLLEGDAELKCPWLGQTDSNLEPQLTSAFWVGSLRLVVRDFRVPRISLFLKPNGEGEKVQIEGAAPDMSEYGGAIKTESIIVHCGMWLVFSKPLFQGDPYILEPGGYPNRTSWGAEDPQVCSLESARIGGPTVEKPNEPKLLLFQNTGFEGTCLEVTRDMHSIQGEPNLRGEQLYSLGSLKASGGCWVGYEKEGFRGHQYLLEEGEYNDFSDWGGCTEELGSVRLIRTDFSQPEIVLYELPGCLEGPCLRLSESLADLEEAQYGTSTGSIHVLSGVWVAYENVDFSGEQYILEKGIYHNYQDWGAESGKISSVQPVIQVGGNSLHFVSKIHLFSEPNFYGDCLTCSEDHMELPEYFSPQSCRVECGSWSLYEGENCSGEQYILSEGEYPTRTAMGCLTPCPLRSFKMVPLYFSIPSISLHGLERFEGKELDFTEEVRSLQGEGYNNHVMSVSVKSGIWVVYEHSDFRGRQWLLERKQIPNWLLYSGLQRIGSLCPIRQRTVYFRLRNRNLGLFLCIAELTEDMKAARVLVTEPEDGRCLLWYYEEGRLKNQMAPHMSLQVIGQSCSGTKVVLWSESRKPIQTWILEDSGCITSCIFEGMCLDVKGGQCYDSDHVVIWETAEDRPTQQWDLEVF